MYMSVFTHLAPPLSLCVDGAFRDVGADVGADVGRGVVTRTGRTWEAR